MLAALRVRLHRRFIDFTLNSLIADYKGYFSKDALEKWQGGGGGGGDGAVDLAGLPEEMLAGASDVCSRCAVSGFPASAVNRICSGSPWLTNTMVSPLICCSQSSITDCMRLATALTSSTPWY